MASSINDYYVKSSLNESYNRNSKDAKNIQSLLKKSVNRSLTFGRKMSSNNSRLI